jgi:fatty-acyl-CoA synthase
MNLSRIIEGWARQAPGRTALHFHGEDLSYAALWRRIEIATHGLAGLGVQRGDRVAWLGYNHPEMLVLLFACARLGALLVPLNWRLTASEHRTILEDCSPRLLCYEQAFAEHGRSLPAGKHLLTGDTHFGDHLPLAAPALAGSDADEVLIVYTSGTTGKPKGAVLTQSALLWNGFNAIHAQDLGQDDHVLSPLPLFHVGGLNNQTLPALLAGACVSLLRRFEPGAWLEAVRVRRPSLSLLVPATMQAVIGHADWAATDLSSLRMLWTGSMVVPESLIRAFHARGIPVGQIYGSTETAPVAAVLMQADARRKAGSAGKPALHCELRIVDGDGRECAPGQTGELRVRGPNLMRRYWNDAQATAAAFDAGGWFCSGDLGHWDAEGFLWISGRSRELIISGGENIHPAELENVLADCPEIAEAAVIGIDDARWGEAACAVVVRKPGAVLDEAAVLALFQDRLARFKHPRQVVFVEALPRNAMGKVQKSELGRALRKR